MTGKLNRSVVQKRSNLINWRDWKFNIRISVKLLKKITQINCNCNKHVSANWEKWDKLITGDLMKWFKQLRIHMWKKNRKIKLNMKRNFANKRKKSNNSKKYIKKKNFSMMMNSKSSKIKPKEISNSKRNKTKIMLKYFNSKTTKQKLKRDIKKHSTTSRKEILRNKNIDSNTPWRT